MGEPIQCVGEISAKGTLDHALAALSFYVELNLYQLDVLSLAAHG